MTYPVMRSIVSLLFVTLAAVAASTDPIEGIWTGTVNGPQGPAALTLVFARNDAGRFDVTVHMPVMHTYGFTFAGAGEGGAGRYAFDPLNVKLQLSGTDTLTGTFGGGQLPVTLHRGGELTPEPAEPDYPPAPAPRWTHNLGAPTWATPVAADGVVYVGTNDGRFHAVDAARGTAVWTWAGPNRIDARAAVTADAIVFVDGRNDLVCLERRDGTLRWRFPLYDSALAAAPLAENPTFNRRTATPLVIGDMICCGSADGGLYAVDLAHGHRRWRHDAGAPIFSGVAEVEPGVVACGTMDGAVILFDYQSQTEVARYATRGGVVTTPVLAGGNVIVGSRDYLLHAFARADGRPAWRFSYWFSWVESTPAVVEGVLYAGASDYRRVTAFDPATGRELWAADVRGLAWGTPVVTADTLFIGTVAQNLPGTVIRHTGGVMALDRGTGAVRWQHRSPPAPLHGFGGHAGSLAVAGDLVIGADFNGTLTAWPIR
jgi:outer membrane protein assembly factor BamB